MPQASAVSYVRSGKNVVVSVTVSPNPGDAKAGVAEEVLGEKPELLSAAIQAMRSELQTMHQAKQADDEIARLQALKASAPATRLA